MKLFIKTRISQRKYFFILAVVLLDATSTVQGDWLDWESWGACSKSCGTGIQQRLRTCSNLKPQGNGNRCFGTPDEYRSCMHKECQVHGGWSIWGTWGSCSESCGMGLQRRLRTCSNPKPQMAGNHCFGTPDEYKPCIIKGCQDGHWSNWGRWNTCSPGSTLKKRYRQCNNPSPSRFGQPCTGNDFDVETCPRPAVSFFASYPSGALTNGHPLFTKVETNVGRAYDKTKAEFTCPISGIYSITLTIDSVPNQSVSCYIYRNTNILSNVVSDGDRRNLATGVISVVLSAGDKVYVDACANWRDATLFAATSFSGTLIAEI